MTVWCQPIRNESRNKRPCTEPFVVDDYGDAVYVGRYTGTHCWPDLSCYYGPAVPQANRCYVDLKSADGLHRDSVREFQNSERNCNTCAKLVRVQRPRCKFGFLYGRCDGSKAGHPYLARMDGDVFFFHPEDHMGMACWEGR